MIKRITITAIVLMFAMAAMAQVNINITMKLDQKFDSVFVKSEAKLQTKKVLRAPYGTSVTLQDKESLKPGMYEILGDSTFLGVILIPNEKKQNFTLTIDNEDVTFLNSKENTGYYDYLKGIARYNKRLDSLNGVFQAAQNNGLPQYMLKVLVDSLSVAARRINDEMRDYQRRIAADNKIYSVLW